MLYQSLFLSNVDISFISLYNKCIIWDSFGGEDMECEQNTLNTEQLDLLSRCPVFQGIALERLAELLDGKIQLRFFQKEEIIYSPHHFEESLCVILEGRAAAVKKDSVLLNTFNAGSCFGVATLFCHSKRYVTTVLAKSRCLAAFLPAELMEELFQKEARISRNYIAFLASRIHFLNRKIDQFTAVSAEEKLAFYLLEQLEKGNPIHMEMSFSCLADTLDLSRSSLYRAMDALEAEGILRKEGRLLHILSEEALELQTEK